MSKTMSSIDLLSEVVTGLASGEIQIVDLTMPLGPDTPVLPLPPPWPNSPAFEMTEISRYDDRGPAWYWNSFVTGEHTGTHFDAPVHWVSGKDLPDNRVDTLPPTKFVAPACVVDVVAEVAADPDYCLTSTRVMEWEREHGQIPAGAWVLMRTDWSKRTDFSAYLNVGEDGPHTPGWTADCVRLLVDERDVLGAGVETVGTDAGQAFAFEPPFPCHTFMHGGGKLGLASLCNLDLLPPTGAIVIAAPLKLVNGSGSPLRVVALAPGNAHSD
ncbi:MAG: cyclase family protein [Thermomicrobiales bacterium]